MSFLLCGWLLSAIPVLANLPGGASGNSPGVSAYHFVNPPKITSVLLDNAGLVISGSGGINSVPFVVLATTNLIAAAWTPVVTNQFDSSGNFTLTLTNAINPNQSRNFYKLQLP